jgi:metal-responsive CopG/Arc/MetJ family transcriptional regulator
VEDQDRNHNRANWNTKTIAVSLPKELIEKLDDTIGDIPRSRYVK